MKQILSIIIFCCACLEAPILYAQISFKAGDKVEVLFNNNWQSASVVKIPQGKSKNYLVQLNDAFNSKLNAAPNNLRVPVTAKVIATGSNANAIVKNAENYTLQMGRYDLYSGIPTTYIGHIILLPEGKYKLALSTDENAYEIGGYLFHTDTNQIEWLTGMCKHNGWTGTITGSNNFYRITLNKVTYAENN